MKKIWIVLPLVLLLAGCHGEKELETISDEYVIPASVSNVTLSLELPEEAALAVTDCPDGSKLYQCEGYTVLVQTLDSGDLGRTIKEVTGLEKDALTILKQKQGDLHRYSYAWTTASESEQQICRGVLLDDGQLHYAVTVMADYTLAGTLDDQWQQLLSSAHLISTD